MSDDSRKLEPTAGDIRESQAQSLARSEDFGFNYDRRAHVADYMNGYTKVFYFDDEKQKKYELSREKLLSSPLLTDDLLKKTMINKFVDFILTNSEDPFDSFCEVVSHFKGITKDSFIKMDHDERVKILGEK